MYIIKTHHRFTIVREKSRKAIHAAKDVNRRRKEDLNQNRNWVTMTHQCQTMTGRHTAGNLLNRVLSPKAKAKLKCT